MRALNGLGYIYFYGQGGLEKNSTKAFQYFLQAALTESDGDSLFNAAVCLHNGLGTQRDLPRAKAFYQIAAERFGHFGSVKALGTMLLEVRGLVGVKFRCEITRAVVILRVRVR